LNFLEYQEATERTAPTGGKLTRLHNYVYGLNGETGEFTDYLKKVIFHYHRQDDEAVKSELGDILYYLTRLCVEFGFTLEEVADYNVNVKLAKRYPDGFDPERSQNRD
jgi:NTP pyrophosphatase (non-canonical NTP hydrolase)